MKKDFISLFIHLRMKESELEVEDRLSEMKESRRTIENLTIRL